jgi:hypothetical protein
MPQRRSARLAPPPPAPARPAARRPVVLATMGVPVAPAGERMAIDSALETHARLVLVNVRVVPVAPLSRYLLGVEGLTMPHEEALDEVRATAARAAGEGVETLLLRVGTRHPARALLEVVREQEAGLLVLAPDPDAIGPRALRRLARRVSATAGCLLWVAPDGPVDSRRALL